MMTDNLADTMHQAVVTEMLTTEAELRETIETLTAEKLDLMKKLHQSDEDLSRMLQALEESEASINQQKSSQDGWKIKYNELNDECEALQSQLAIAREALHLSMQRDHLSLSHDAAVAAATATSTSAPTGGSVSNRGEPSPRVSILSPEEQLAEEKHRTAMLTSHLQEAAAKLKFASAALTDSNNEVESLNKIVQRLESHLASYRTVAADPNNKFNEIARLQQQLDQADASLNDERDRYRDLQMKTAQLQKDILIAAENLRIAAKDMQVLEQSNKKYENHIHELLERLKAAEAIANNNNIVRLQQREQMLEEKLDAEIRRRTIAEAKCIEAGMNLQDAAKSLNYFAEKQKEDEAAVESLKNELNQAKSELARPATTSAAMQDENILLKSQLMQAEKAESELNARAVLLAEQLAHLQEELTATRGTHQAALKQQSEDAARRIGDLQSQLQAATAAHDEKLQQLASTRSAQDADLAALLAQTQAQLASAQSSVGDLTAQLASAQERVQALEADVDKARSAAQQASANAANAANQASQASQAAAAQLQHLTENNKDLTLQINDVKITNADLSRKLESLTSEVVSLQRENETLRSSANAEATAHAASAATPASLLTAAANSKEEDMRTQISDAEAALAKSQQQLQEAERRIEELNAEHKEFKAMQVKLRSSAADIESLNETIVSLQATNRDFVTQAPNMQALDAANSEIAQLREMLTQASQRCADLENNYADFLHHHSDETRLQMSKALSQLSDEAQANRDLRAAANQHAHHASSLVEELQAARQQAAVLRKENETLRRHVESSHQETLLLSEKFNALVQTHAQDLARMENANLEVADKVTRMTWALQERLRITEADDNINTSTAAEELARVRRELLAAQTALVEKDQQVVQLQAMLETSNNNVTRIHDRAEAEKLTFRAELTKFEQSLLKASAALDAADAEKAELARSLQLAQADSALARNQIQGYERELLLAKMAASNAETVIFDLRAEFNSHATRHHYSDLQIAQEHHAVTEQLRHGNIELSEQVTTLLQRLSQTEDVYEDLQLQYSALKSEQERWQREMFNTSEIVQLRSANAMLQENNNLLVAKLAEATRTVDNTRFLILQEQNKRQEELQMIEDSLSSDVNNNVEDIVQYANAMEGKISDKTKHILAMVKRFASVAGGRHSAENEKLSWQVEDLRVKLKEEAIASEKLSNKLNEERRLHAATERLLRESESDRRRLEEDRDQRLLLLAAKDKEALQLHKQIAAARQSIRDNNNNNNNNNNSNSNNLSISSGESSRHTTGDASQEEILEKKERENDALRLKMLELSNSHRDLTEKYTASLSEILGLRKMLSLAEEGAHLNSRTAGLIQPTTFASPVADARRLGGGEGEQTLAAMQEKVERLKRMVGKEASTSITSKYLEELAGEQQRLAGIEEDRLRLDSLSQTSSGQPQQQPQQQQQQQQQDGLRSMKSYIVPPSSSSSSSLSSSSARPSYVTGGVSDVSASSLLPLTLYQTQQQIHRSGGGSFLPPPLSPVGLYGVGVPAAAVTTTTTSSSSSAAPTPLSTSSAAAVARANAVLNSKFRHYADKGDSSSSSGNSNSNAYNHDHK